MRTIAFALAAALLAAIPTAAQAQEEGAAVTDTEITADSLLDRADEVFQSRDYEAALARYEAVVKLAREEFNRSVEIEGMAQAARMNLILNRKEEGRQWLTRAEERAVDSDPMGWSRYLGVKGRFEWQDAQLKEAHQTFDRMYTYCSVNDLYGRAVDAAHMIAIVAETPEEQIEWGRKGIAAAEAGDVESWLGPLWNNLAGTYYDMEDFENALDCYLKAREYHWRFSGEIAKLFADYHVGMTYRLLGKVEEAEKWLRPVLAWAERIENHGAIGQTCEDLGEIAAVRGDKAAAAKLFARARDEYKLEGYDKSWPDIWENIGQRLAAMKK